MKPFIGYHFFHGVGKIAPAKAYSRTQRAMNDFADQKAPSYRGFILDMRDDEGGAFQSAYEALCAEFGPVTNTMKSLSAQGAPTYRAHYWTLALERFESSFMVLEKIRNDIPAVEDRVSVQASWSLKFVRPNTGITLPNQESMPEIDMRLGPGSSLTLTTGHKTSANAWFLFPFESISQDFDDYVQDFQKALIFKFSPSHWRLWKFHPTRGWSPKKIVPSWYQSGASLANWR
jgi:hypothetical protein